MPVEIRELVIRATVESTGTDRTAAGRDGGRNRKPDRDEVVAECVEQVLEILRQREER